MNRSVEEIQQDIIYYKAKLQSLKNELQKATEGMVECHSCHSFFHPENLSVGTYETTGIETVFTDAGYGDDDELATVTRQHNVKRCPKCGYEIEHTNIFLRETDRHRRN